jgi:tetratricopeptide (TPR) repeat protein
VGVALLVMSVPTRARAETPPVVWERLAKPSVTAELSLHIDARRALMRRQSGPEDFALFGELQRQEQLELVLKRLQTATKSPESVAPRLLADLGEVYEELGMHRMAIQVLRPLVERAPSESFVEDAWLALAYAYAKTEDAQRERGAYIEYLKTAKHPRSRNVATLNLAEAEMRIGNLEASIEGYRAALEQANREVLSQETAILAVWGLAVALDRYGDARAAAEEAERAARLDEGMHLIGEGENVFFAPAHERYWYLGLGWLATARASTSNEERINALTRAASAWQAYVAKTQADDPWLPRAKQHLEVANKLLKKAQRTL